MIGLGYKKVRRGSTGHQILDFSGAVSVYILIHPCCFLVNYTDYNMGAFDSTEIPKFTKQARMVRNMYINSQHVSIKD